jgi:hypothetical protein
MVGRTAVQLRGPWLRPLLEVHHAAPSILLALPSSTGSACHVCRLDLQLAHIVRYCSTVHVSDTRVRERSQPVKLTGLLRCIRGCAAPPICARAA